MAWLTSWSSRKQIDVQDTNVDSDLTNFPVYVGISADGDMSEAQADGEDIRFTQSDGETLLYYERESWSGGGGSAVTADFWVKVPSVAASGGATIYIYYGKADALDGEDAENVWDANYKAVWHLSNSFLDSSGNNHTLTNHTTTDVAGKIARARRFDGNDHLSGADHADWDPGGAFTIEAWVYIDIQTTDVALVQPIQTDYTWLLYYSHAASPRFTTRVRQASGTPAVITPAGNIDQWYHIVGTFDRTLGSARLKIYRDGDLQDSDDAYDEDCNADATGIWMGQKWSTSGAVLKGWLDEVRFSHTARSAAWIRFEHANINEADNELTWGAEESGAFVSIMRVKVTDQRYCYVPDTTHKVKVDETVRVYIK